MASDIIVERMRIFPAKRTIRCAASARYFLVTHWNGRKNTMRKNSAPEENNMQLLWGVKVNNLMSTCLLLRWYEASNERDSMEIVFSLGNHEKIERDYENI